MSTVKHTLSTNKPKVSRQRCERLRTRTWWGRSEVCDQWSRCPQSVFFVARSWRGSQQCWPPQGGFTTPSWMTSTWSKPLAPVRVLDALVYAIIVIDGRMMHLKEQGCDVMSKIDPRVGLARPKIHFYLVNLVTKRPIKKHLH